MAPPHLRHRMSNTERQMDTYGRGRAGDTPIQSGGGAGEFGGRPGWMDFTPPQQDRSYTGRNPFTTPHQGFPDSGMRGRSEGIESLRRPEGFTNLNMLGRPDLSFRYSHIDPSQRGVGTGGAGEMSNRPDYFRDDESIRGTYGRTQTGRTVADRDPRANEMDEYGYLKGAPRQRTTFTEGYMDPADFDEMYGGVYDDAIMRGMNTGIGGLQEQAAVDPSDWRTILKILEAGGDPGTETQTAELTEDQMNMMGNPLNTPDFGVSKEDLWNRTKGMEDQGFFGWGAQEPTTQEEFEDYYRQLQEGTVGNWVT